MLDSVDLFLSRTDWADAKRLPLAQDASSRHYQRLVNGSGASAILAQDPSPASVRSFCQIGTHLKSIELSAPEIYACDPETGFVLQEDLGDGLFTDVITNDPGAENRLYYEAIEAILVAATATPPAIEPFTAAEMAAQNLLAFEAYASQPSRDAEKILSDLYDRFLSSPAALILRDVHAGNLIWLPERDGPARVGFLDFQDARLASPLYDVVSLIDDARRDLRPEISDDLYVRAADALGRDLNSVQKEAAVLSLQRNLRILGVFARLGKELGRTEYLQYLPRTWRFVQSALQKLDDAHLFSAVGQRMPEPTPSFLKSMEKECGSRPKH